MLITHPLSSMVTFPDKIKIGNRSVSVSVAEIEDKNIMGYYDLDNFAIVLSARLTPVQAVGTFWHEMMHAIFDFTRFNVDMQVEMQDKDTPAEDAFKIEERAAENFAKTFLQVIQDNNLMDIKMPQ